MRNEVNIIFEMRAAIGNFLADAETGLSFEQMAAQVGSADVKAILAIPTLPRSAYEAMLAQSEKVRAGIRTYFAEQRIEALAFPPARNPAHKIGEDSSMTVRGQSLPSSTTIGRNVALSSCASMKGCYYVNTLHPKEPW